MVKYMFTEQRLARAVGPDVSGVNKAESRAEMAADWGGGGCLESGEMSKTGVKRVVGGATC